MHRSTTLCAGSSSLLHPHGLGADALEKSAQDAPDLAALLDVHVRLPLLKQLIRYLEMVDAVRRIPSPVTPEYAARFILETVTWWARHRHRDPDPPLLEESEAREVAVALVAGFFSGRSGEP